MQNRASRDSADGSHTPLRDHRDRDRERDRGKPVDSDKARRHSKEEAHRRRSDDRTPTGGDTTLRSIFKPIREHLRRVSQVTKENIPSKSQRVAELRRLLQVVGDFIHGILDGQETAASLEERLWFVLICSYHFHDSVILTFTQGLLCYYLLAEQRNTWERTSHYVRKDSEGWGTRRSLKLIPLPSLSDLSSNIYLPSNLRKILTTLLPDITSSSYYYITFPAISMLLFYFHLFTFYLVLWLGAAGVCLHL